MDDKRYIELCDRLEYWGEHLAWLKKSRDTGWDALILNAENIIDNIHTQIKAEQATWEKKDE